MASQDEQQPFYEEGPPDDHVVSSWAKDGQYVVNEMRNLRNINNQQLTKLKQLESGVSKLESGHSKIEQTLHDESVKRQTYRNLWSIIGSVLGFVVALLEIFRAIKGSK